MIIRGYLLLLASTAAALAQPSPKLSSISPEWIQRGMTIDVTLNGVSVGSDMTDVNGLA